MFFLSGCPFFIGDRGIDVKGEIVNIKDDPVHGCTLSLIDGAYQSSKELEGNEFYKMFLTGSTPSKLFVTVYCSEEYEIFTSKKLSDYLYKNDAVYLGKIVMHPKSEMQ